MSENKFIERLQGKNTAKAVLEVNNQSVKTSFARMPQGSSNANDVYTDRSGDAVAVLQGAENWKLNGTTLDYASSVSGNGQDYSGESDQVGGSVVLGGDGMAVSGAGLWIDAEYTFVGDPTKTAAIFNKNTKWALKLCGHSLASANENIDLTLLIKIGTSSVISKTFVVRRNAFQFCEDLVIDFAESNANTVKVLGNGTLKLQVLCSDTTASATLYNGMTVLTALQRRVDADTVSMDTYNIEDISSEISDIITELDNKVNIDGTSVMTGPLLMRATSSFQCAIAPFWDGVGFFKLNSDDSVTLIASIETPDGFVPWDTNTLNIGSSVKKWKDLYVARVITAVLNNGADINVPTTSGTLGLNDFSNITDSAKNIANWSSNITNCITEIPQDINLELNNGTLTLKAGSKVYVPNGSGIFDTVTTSADITVNSPWGGGTDDVMLFVNGTSFTGIPATRCYSGASQPTVSGGTDAYWYDTTNNVIKRTTDTGATWTATTYSLPIAIFSRVSGTITTIKQVFNGFGYIGSTIFALPGVKGLIPNGRNADGTLKNISATISSVSVITNPDNNSNKILHLNSGRVIGQGNTWFTSTTQPSFIENNNNFWYNPDTNLVYYYRSSGNVNNGFVQRALLGYFVTNASAQITSFNPKFAFHAVDYSDTDFIGHQAMPSGRYIDLTLGISPFNVTAPADGYLVFAKNASTVGYEIRLKNQSNSLEVHDAAGKNNQDLAVTISCSKGDVIRVYFNADGVTSSFRFVYANGAK